MRALVLMPLPFNKTKSPEDSKNSFKQSFLNPAD